MMLIENSEGEFKKRIEVSYTSRKLEPSDIPIEIAPILTAKDVLQILEDAKKAFPKERQGLCDVADPDKGICIHQPSHSEYQDWFKKWFGSNSHE